MASRSNLAVRSRTDSVARSWAGVLISNSEFIGHKVTAKSYSPSFRFKTPIAFDLFPATKSGEPRFGACSEEGVGLAHINLRN
jgi:hypothetical protein